MKYDNVLPFDPVGPGGMARRGAPDKSGAIAPRVILLECPTCAGDVGLEEDGLEGRAAVLCGRCETEIPLVSPRQEGAG